MDYRLRVLERFLDQGFMAVYKGDESEINALKIAVYKEMQQEIKGFTLELRQYTGLQFRYPTTC
jgi:hypothetical protein